MKKRFLAGIATGVFLFGMVGVTQAIPLFVDAAPNKYGSPDYSSWESNAYASVVAGTFVNMASSINSDNIGTTNFEIQDEVVYSFGDLGKRLTWIYYIEGETVDSLSGTDRFQISLTNVWDGSSWDFYDYYYESTWLEPTTWVNYDTDGDGSVDGVIGTAGMAWWGAYGINTQEALDADIASWGLSEESWIFTAKL
ncbi:MAG: hypothetical protein L3J49_11105, partial [Desulfobulbaceae bacterium]|nr:hypothetical protein [Desulfobulbaceae bacterium]